MSKNLCDCICVCVTCQHVKVCFSPLLNFPVTWPTPVRLSVLQDGVASHDENMQYLSLAVQACVEKRNPMEDSEQGQDGRPSLKRDSSGVNKVNSNRKEERKTSRFSPPFGPHLVPVPCMGQSHTVTDRCPKDNSLSRDHNPQRALVSDSQSRTAGTGSDSGDRDLHSSQKASVLAKDPHEEVHSRATLSTSDLLECLVHPDVIALVSQLLLDRQRELASSSTAQHSHGVV